MYGQKLEMWTSEFLNVDLNKHIPHSGNVRIQEWIIELVACCTPYTPKKKNPL